MRTIRILRKISEKQLPKRTDWKMKILKQFGRTEDKIDPI